jgi:hypothetical protein
MYTVKIRALAKRILAELGRFGDEKRRYFRPRFITVKRVAGEPNCEGSLIQYRVWPRFLSFNLVLERNAEHRYVVYRVMNGFAKGGLMIFEIEELDGTHSGLSIYVTFDFPVGKGRLNSLVLAAAKLLFPAFIHDVIWNHSLCELKDCVESQTT